MGHSLRCSFMLTAVALALSGCHEEPCTLDNRPSVLLTVIDAESKQPIPDPVISYRIDGGELQTMVLPLHDEWIVGREQAGLFEIEIEADGYELAIVEVEVDEDHCHPHTVSETVELVPLE